MPGEALAEGEKRYPVAGQVDFFRSWESTLCSALAKRG